MILRIYILVLICFSLISTSGNAAECAKGTQTILQSNRINVSSLPRHDQMIGQTEFILRSEPDGKKLLSKKFEGDWFCIGFNRNTKTYVVGGIFERGAWLPMGSIQYLREDGSSFEPSVFDRLGYLAMTAAISPSGKYIVFIGGQNTSDKLYVLDIERNAVRELGPAPAPPPNALAKDICNSEPFEWGTCWGEGFVEMDTGIIRFQSEKILAVSYGSDSPHARAKKRRIRLFKLD